jgi:biotin carboxylase
MPRSLLVLGASTYQLDAIRTAKRLGYRVITTDNRPDNPGHALSDRSFGFDATDSDAVAAVARAEGVAGILSPCTDVAVPTAARVAADLGLRGVPLRAAQILTNKVAFRRFLYEEDLPAPHYHEIRTNGRMPRIDWHKSFWILKPDFSSGSKGIFVVRDEKELASRMPESRAFSPSGTLVLEQFIAGHQATCEGVLVNGRIKLSVVLDRQTATVPYVVTTGHHLPTNLGPAAVGRLHKRLEHVWSRLGVAEGPFDCDFVWSEGEVFLLEMTPRLGGNSISQLLRIATGFDLVEYAVHQACGAEIALPPRLDMRPSAVVLLGADRSGNLLYNKDELLALRNEPWVDSLTMDVRHGATVEKFINGRHRLGEAFITADTRDGLENRVAELRSRLEIRGE